jgi:anti-sigma-K factor RskA
MHDSAMLEHLTIVAMLPDYVLGKLDETSLRRVARHLDFCAICRDECANAMDVLGSFAMVSPPPARVRDAILQRAAVAKPAARGQDTATTRSPRQIAGGGVALKLLSVARHPQAQTPGAPFPRWALVASAAVLFLLGGLVGWSHVQDNSVVSDDRILALMNDPAAAYPLDDSDLSLPAAGVVFAAPKGREIYLVANGLPVLPRDQRYQVWLFTTRDERVSAGLVAVGDDGAVRALLQTPDPFVDYVGVALTAEPQTGSSAPTSDLVLGGSFPPLTAALPTPPAPPFSSAGSG